MGAFSGGTVNSRERVLAMLEGAPVDHLPCMPILMQFAGDLIGSSYINYATNFRFLTEGQMRAAGEFGIDHVNTMSDPAGEAADCGAAVKFFPNQPPALDGANALLTDKTLLDTLEIPDPYVGQRMHKRLQALALYKQRVGGEKLIEGWVEGPCAQGADLRGINSLMLDFYDDPAFVRRLFDFVLKLELRFAAAQIREGAELIGIGDAAASLVGPQIYEDFVWEYEKKMVDGLHALGAKVRLHICGDIRLVLDSVGRLGCDLVDLDYMVPISEAREKIGADQVLLGNIDPVRVLREGSPESVEAAIAECHRQAGPHYIVGAGCEVPRDTPQANLRALTRYAQENGQ